MGECVISMWWVSQDVPKTKVEDFEHLTYTGWLERLEHLKIVTRLKNEKFVNVMGETPRLS
jgi:hypothetical protein